MHQKLLLLSICFFLSGSFVATAQDRPLRPYEMFEEAERAYNDDQYQESLLLLDKCLKHFPGYFDAYALRGAVREILKDTDGALTDYSIYLEQYPENLPALMS